MNRAWQDPPEYRDPGGGMSMAMPGMTPLIKRLIIANAVVFVIGFIWWSSSKESWGQIVRVVGITPELWKDWFPFLPVWQLVTWAFVHSVQSPFHLLMNMLFLYFLGSMLEGIIGSRRFLATYAIAVVFSGICTLLVGLVMGDSVPTIGASGGVLAIVVAVATLRPTTRIIFIIIPMTLKVFALLYVGLDLFNAVNVVFNQQSTGVAHFAHLAGAAYGYAAVRLGWVWRDPIAELDERRERRAQAARANDEERLDALLERINKEGIHSLSERERNFLKRASKRR